MCKNWEVISFLQIELSTPHSQTVWFVKGNSVFTRHHIDVLRQSYVAKFSEIYTLWNIKETYTYFSIYIIILQKGSTFPLKQWG